MFEVTTGRFRYVAVLLHVISRIKAQRFTSRKYKKNTQGDAVPLQRWRSLLDEDEKSMFNIGLSGGRLTVLGNFGWGAKTPPHVKV